MWVADEKATQATQPPILPKRHAFNFGARTLDLELSPA